MGMTDRQFDVHQENQLSELVRIQKELAEVGVTNTTLDEMIKKIERQLKRP
ncbi:MAG: hypothetical protein FWB98_06015 [Defluviitaleaceae bacterium]|nr:hypothetical protein [Defluviitaleaceae bacterium]